MQQYFQEFGHYSFYGSPATTNGPQITLWYDWTGQLTRLNPQVTQDLAGWTLSAHHFYDGTSHTLYYGEGTRRSADTLKPIVTMIAGANTVSTCTQRGQGIGDNGPAVNATFGSIGPLAAASDGTIYVAENTFIRKIDPSGTITRFAGGGTNTADGSLLCRRSSVQLPRWHWAPTGPSILRMTPAGNDSSTAGHEGSLHRLRRTRPPSDWQRDLGIR